MPRKPRTEEQRGLYFQRIERGYWVSGCFEIRRSIFGSRQWIVRYDDQIIGFRPTLELAKRLAERMGRAA